MLRNVSHATALATASNDPVEILRATTDAVVRVFGATRADVWSFGDGALRHAGAAGAGPASPPAPFELVHQLTRGGLSQTLDFDELRRADPDGEWARLAYAVGSARLCFLALSADDQQLGMIAVMCDDAFAEAEALTVFAGQVAQALLKARLHEAVRDASEQAALQNRLLSRFSECRDVGALAAAVQLQSYQTVPGAHAIIAIAGRGTHASLFDDDCGSRPRSIAVDSVGILDRIVRRDLSQGALGAVPSTHDHAVLGLRVDADQGGPLIGIPLGTHGRSLGALLIACPRPHDEAAARELVRMMGPAASLALDNALLLTRATLRSERLSAANDISRTITTADNSDGLLERLATGLHQRLGYSRVSIHPGPDGDHADDPLLEHGELAIDQGRAERELVARASHHGCVSRSDHPERASCALPMFVKGVLVRVLYVEQPIDGIADLDEHDRALLGTVAEQACGTLTTLAAYEHLERNYLSTIKSLASALEASDQYTHDHAQDVAMWAVQVATELDLDDGQIKDIELGAIFHDIGKIAIPTHILHKPGRLTDDEFEVMKTHTIMGERIIAPLDFLENVKPIVRHEHERWDGHGYPDGLAGETIPLGSRIIFVCDAYHAITSDRPYREAQSHEVARRVLVENAGTQFDPMVVAAFLNVIEHHFGADASEQLDVGPPASRGAHDQLPLGVRDAVARMTSTERGITNDAGRILGVDEQPEDDIAA